MKYLNLFLLMMLTVGASTGLYLLETKTGYKYVDKRWRNIINGIAFGVVAIINTEYGVNMDMGFVANIRDAAPVCAGLLFSPTAGIIAGVIGGVERWFAVYWGIGTYTRIACSVGTFCSGLIAAFVVGLMFKDNKPNFKYGLGIGMVAELFHIMILFFVGADLQKNLDIIKSIAFPMIVGNAIAVGLSCLIITLLERKKTGISSRVTLSKFYQKFSADATIVVLCISIALIFFTNTGYNLVETKDTINKNIDDVFSEISLNSDRALMEKGRSVAEQLENKDEITDADLIRLSIDYEICEINLIDSDGIITASTEPDFHGFNMYSGEQAVQFMSMISDKYMVVQPYLPTTYSQDTTRKYMGIKLDGDRILQIGYSVSDIRRDTIGAVRDLATFRRVGQDGWIIIVDNKGEIVSSGQGNINNSLKFAGLNEDINGTEGELRKTVLYGKKYFASWKSNEGYTIIGLMSADEAFFYRDLVTVAVGGLEIIIFAGLFLAIIYYLEVYVVRNVRKFNDAFREISSGNLNLEIEPNKIYEFNELAKDANTTVHTLHALIDEAAERVEQELQLAKSIQEGALERVFPPFPDEERFDIHCTMDPAKEVGGDFYDFFFIGENKFAILIADVSGKGIPAAMFMMTSKTLIKSMAQSGLPVEQVMKRANDELCAHNEAGMFVTCWLGIVDLNTGQVTYSNAGHNPPLLRRKNRQYNYLKGDVNLVLAAMEGIPYKANEIMLDPGDEIFLYTDGVTEAINKEQELYGEDRLKDCLDNSLTDTAYDTCVSVKNGIDNFVGEAEQFDDITMLNFKFGFGTKTRSSIKKESRNSLKNRKSNMVVFEEISEEMNNEKNGDEEVLLMSKADEPEVLLMSKTEEPEVLLMSKAEEPEVLLMSKAEEPEEVLLMSKAEEPEVLLMSKMEEPEEVLLMSKAEEPEKVLMSDFDEAAHNGIIEENEFEAELTIEATTDNIPKVTEFVDTQLEKFDCPMKEQTQIDIAVDELMSNIAYYAYEPDTGTATVKVAVIKEPLQVTITFIDHGIPYDPLKKADPNTNLPLEERGVGGLGIFMVKQTMDNIEYSYENGKNVLSITKNIH